MTAAILQIQSTGYYVAGIAGRFQAGFSVYRSLQLFLEVPRGLKTITVAMPGDSLSKLSHEDARALYEALAPAYMRLRQSVAITRQRFGTFGGILLGWWFHSVEGGLDNMEDLLETLAWGSDVELRDHIDSAVLSIREQAIP